MMIISQNTETISDEFWSVFNEEMTEMKKGMGDISTK